MRNRTNARHGVMLIYMIIIMPIVCGVCALAVDFGCVEYNKFQLQQIADASAHDYMVLYAEYGSQSSAQSNISTTKNSIFSLNGSPPTVSATWGYWNTTTQTFSTTSSAGTFTAVKVVASCTKANNNAIPLLFGTVIGQPTIDVSATSVAAAISSTSSISVSATSNPYLSGMPTTSTTVWGDNGILNAATKASIAVVPGTYLTFTSISGTTSVTYPTMPYYGPNGSTGSYGRATQHGQNWDGTMMSANTENGIGNAIMPESALMGVFLDNKQPDSTAAPSAVVDYTTTSMQSKGSFSNLALKSPFFIGDGTIKSGGTRTFQVPAGATRLFVGIWDGVDYNNNVGSLSGKVTIQNQIFIVQ